MRIRVAFHHLISFAVTRFLYHQMTYFPLSHPGDHLIHSGELFYAYMHMHICTRVYLHAMLYGALINITNWGIPVELVPGPFLE